MNLKAYLRPETADHCFDETKYALCINLTDVRAFFREVIVSGGDNEFGISARGDNAVEVFVDEGDSGVAVNEARGGYGTGWFSFPGNVPVVIPEKAIVRLAAKAMSTGVAVTGGFNIMIQGSGAGTTVTSS